MIALYRSGNKAFIAAEYEGILRPPVLFDSSMFPELLRLEGDAGARKIIQGKGSGQGMAFGWHDATSFLDIDTQDDYTSISCGKGTD